jgi:citrate lyase beta subunit
MEHAQRVLESYEAAVARGQGATSLGNEMVDLATARRAERILGHGDTRTH